MEQFRTLIAWLGGVIVGSFLVVTDEILTESMYCGRSCLYPYPLLGVFNLYDAFSIAFGAILAGIVMTIVCLLPKRSDYRLPHSTNGATKSDPAPTV